MTTDDLMNTGPEAADSPRDVDLFEALKVKVLAGEPIYLGGPIDSPMAALHLRLVERLKATTGRSVTVIFH